MIFMIFTYECDAVGITNIECKEEEECFDRIIALVYKVAQEVVVLVGAFST